MHGLTNIVQKYTIRGELVNITYLYGMIDFLYLKEVIIANFNMKYVCNFLYPQSKCFTIQHASGHMGDILFIAPK